MKWSYMQKIKKILKYIRKHYANVNTYKIDDDK